MKKFIRFIFLFPIIFLIFVYSLAFIDHALGLGICHSLLFDVFYYRRFEHHSSPEKSCFNRQRQLIGAVEMYNMDHKEMMTTLDVEELIREGYLKSKIEDSIKDCIYCSDGDLTDSGIIYCKYHGEPTQEKHKPSPEYYNKQQRKNFKRTFSVLAQYAVVFLIVGTITWAILK